MASPYQINIIRKDNQTMVNIGTMPTKEVFTMLHSAVDLVAQKTNLSFKDALAVLQEIDDFAKITGQK